MSSIESLANLEKNSKEFQNLSQDEQNHRRGLLSDILGTIIEKGRTLEYTPKETGVFVSIALELYITGTINSIEKHPIKKYTKNHNRHLST